MLAYRGVLTGLTKSNDIQVMVVGTRDLKYWVLGPSVADVKCWVEVQVLRLHIA